jgi:hypothetical protein
MNSYILMLIIAMGNNGNTQLPTTSSTAVFGTQSACEAAMRSVQAKLDKRANIILLTCEKHQ